LAATADVEVLASLSIMLKSAALDALAQLIDRVAVTQPSIPALTQEDLKDALEYAGIRSVSQYASTDAFLEAESISSYFS
jgi:2-phospho-L-lactate guanylyltransferase (CobY/MobA/RfbA family)